MFSSAMIYCPRNITLDQSIKWITDAGFDIPFVSDKFDYGIVGNYIFACRWLLENTNSEWIIIWENDVMPCFSSKKELEYCIQNIDNDGCISLYTPIRDNKKIAQGWQKLNPGFRNVAGQAMCYRRDRLEWLLKIYNWETLIVASKINQGAGGGVDSASGYLFKEHNISILFHNPSLCQHMGLVSARPGNTLKEWNTGLNFNLDYKSEYII